MASGAIGESDMASIDVEAGKRMFKGAMKGDWETVVKEIKDYPHAWSSIRTRSGDTALHLAVYDGQLEVVQELVVVDRLIDGVAYVLNTKNDRGNTPLHIAAASGQVEMCKYIANKDPNLISARNHDTETPLFLAALHGEKEVFLCLHDNLPIGNDFSNHTRNSDGDTVLHCAIAGEHLGAINDQLEVESNSPDEPGVNSRRANYFTCPDVIPTLASLYVVLPNLLREFEIVLSCGFRRRTHTPNNNFHFFGSFLNLKSRADWSVGSSR